MKSMEFRLIGILMVLSGCPLGAQIVIDPYFAKNPAEKPGYHLIFEDEFEGHQLDLKNRQYTISLRATFPDGHAEELVRKILVTP